MLSLTDCIDMSELSAKEIAVIAEHERVPEIVAAELGSKLIQSPAGRVMLKHYIHDNLVNARARHLDEKARELRLLLKRFEREHPASDHAR